MSVRSLPRVTPAALLTDLLVHAAEGFDLGGLLPLTEYAVRIRAVNRNGPSAWSSVLLAETKHSLPLPPVPVLTALASNDVAVVWDADQWEKDDCLQLEANAKKAVQMGPDECYQVRRTSLSYLAAPASHTHSPPMSCYGPLTAKWDATSLRASAS